MAVDATKTDTELQAVLLVRHPYTRAVSLWRAWDEFPLIPKLFSKTPLPTKPTFEEFIGAAMRRGRWRHFMRGPGRCAYHADTWGKPIKHIVRQEQLEVDTALAYKACFCPNVADNTISPVQLPVLHKTEGRPWYEEYTPTTAAMVQSLWAEDFMRFDYEHNFQNVMLGAYTLEREELYVV